jgi:hypothetical protein
VSLSIVPEESNFFTFRFIPQNDGFAKIETRRKRKSGKSF